MGLISSMGSFSGAEVCELVGLYLLSQIIEIIPKHQVGLYWDDGVLVTDARPESLKKKLCEIFRKNGLSLEAYANLKIIEYGATSIDKIGEVRLSDEIGGGGVWNSEKTELYNYY